MKTIVILGAAGRIGDAASRAFVSAGWRVKGLARGRKGAELPIDVEWLKVDATDRGRLIEACSGADVVLNALNPEYTEWEQKVLPMAENVIAACEATGATQLLPGNVYNFGHGVRLGMAEDMPDAPSTPKARIRIAMEDLFRQRAQQAGVQTLVLRAGDFYGGRKPGSWLDLLILSKLKKDIFTWPGPMDAPHAFAYLPDLARGFVALADRRQDLAPFDRFHFAGHTLSGSEMLAATEKALGHGLQRRGVPWALFRAGGLFMPMLREIATMSYLWQTPHSLDGRKFATVVGPLPSTSPVDAIRQAIADLSLDRAPISSAA
ncbi:NAD-dependent epimerase/dehydratase family protein [Aquibium carbonis]|uniref:NAD-dependent epimerase/dehydratase family protein n=1 Tax=Aquibium carbonis TaxID=2495581 RepID=A0A429Z3P5_9HYPH|nr:NAD-dependent epimerase/dehydratase family protein [Aquibium carbonis]RST88299.1 NAD-dependent epimerase/dehydratase family protein [Aquibium carbonis]